MLVMVFAEAVSAVANRGSWGRIRCMSMQDVGQVLPLYIREDDGQTKE